MPELFWSLILFMMDSRLKPLLQYTNSIMLKYYRLQKPFSAALLQPVLTVCGCAAECPMQGNAGQ